MLAVAPWLLVCAGASMVGGTLLSFSRNPHWFVRIWDFPRVQIASVSAISGVTYAALFFRGHTSEWLFLTALTLCVAWQCYKVYPYTPLAPVRVQRSKQAAGQCDVDTRSRESSVALLVCNVQMENRQYDRFLRVAEESDPDIILALETDSAWVQALAPLAQTHPHVVQHPQDNYYGMVLFSRLKLVHPEVQFLVQKDVPSIRTVFELRSGEQVVLYGLHPRPPEPIRDQSAAPRDAELVMVGRKIGSAPTRPTVVMGDLNDVAWSSTSELFLRLSKLLDPRMGRGFYNSYNANNRLFRFPLDHVFHSNHFKLIALRRLEHVGSDHFPLLIELSYEPQARAEQPALSKQAEDEQEAEQKLERQADAARTGEDRPSRE